MEDTELFLELVMEEKDADLEREIAEKIVDMEKDLALAEGVAEEKVSQRLEKMVN